MGCDLISFDLWVLHHFKIKLHNKGQPPQLSVMLQSVPGQIGSYYKSERFLKASAVVQKNPFPVIVSPDFPSSLTIDFCFVKHYVAWGKSMTQRLKTVAGDQLIAGSNPSMGWVCWAITKIFPPHWQIWTCVLLSVVKWWHNSSKPFGEICECLFVHLGQTWTDGLSNMDAWCLLVFLYFLCLPHNKWLTSLGNIKIDWLSDRFLFPSSFLYFSRLKRDITAPLGHVIFILLLQL